MRIRIGTTLAATAALVLTLATQGRVADHKPSTPIVLAKSRLSSMNSGGPAPVAFTENQGQWPDSIRFRAQSRGAALWFTETGLYYQVITRPAPELSPEGARASISGNKARLGEHGMPSPVHFEWVRMDFVSPEATSRLVPSEPLGNRTNFILGDDPAKWQSNVPGFARVTYKGLYPGVDMVFQGTGGQVECELAGTDAARLAQARVLFSSSHSVSVGADGELKLARQTGDISVRPLGGLHFEKADDGSFGLKAESNRSASAATPASLGLFYGTYFGGSGEDTPFELVVDSSGNVYVAGYTLSVDFPTSNPFQTDSGDYDAFVMKFSPEGDSLQYATYLGGNGADIGLDLKVDSSGQSYVTGYTLSTDFPTLTPYQVDQPGNDAFVAKLNAAGNGLVFSTYLGGSGDDEAYGIAVDAVGIACIAGRTTSSNLPLLNPFQTDQVGRDGFVARLSPNGQNLIYGTYLGGSSEDKILTMFRDTSGNTYVAGTTNSTDFPTQGQYQLHQGDYDVFVAKLDAVGTSLLYSTYIGGTLEDEAQALVVDSAGNAYVAGLTLSTDFPTVNPYQTDQGDYDAFVLKVSPVGDSLIYSTYLSGSIDEYAYALAVDESGSAYVSGMTGSPDFATVNAYQTYQGAYDAFVTRLNAAGNNAVFSTFLGGSDLDYPDGIALDRWGSLYVIGTTYSTDFSTLNPYQGDQPDADGFLVKLCADLDIDCVPDAVDNCPTTYNPLQEDANGNSIGDACDVGDTLVFALYSPVDLVITDPAGDSIGIDSLSRVIFNTILNGSTYDTLTDENSSGLTGPDGDPDDIVTIPVPIAGLYHVRIVREPGADPNAHFTNAIRINGNQQLIPDEYRNAKVSDLGTPAVPSEATYVTALTLPGDANADGLTTSADIIYMVNYVFKSGLSPVVPGHGDCNCDGLNTSADIIYLVNYVFKGGLSPCSQTGG